LRGPWHVQQIHLSGRFDADKPHGPSLNRFSNRLARCSSPHTIFPASLA
jgi:hypothetical protein